MGAAGVAGLGVGAQPAAAVDHELSVDDATVLTYDGGIAELGIRQLSFEVSWENIPDTLRCDFQFRDGSGGLTTLDSGDLDVSLQGSDTFGYGSRNRGDYEQHLGQLGFEIPIKTTSESFLEGLALEEGEDKRTFPLTFIIRVYRNPPDQTGIDVLGTSEGEFDVILERQEPVGGVDDGEAEPYGV